MTVINKQDQEIIPSHPLCKTECGKVWSLARCQFGKNWNEIKQERFTMKQKTFGMMYPYSLVPLCPSCIHRDEGCYFEGRDVARCPDYIQENKEDRLFNQVIGK